MTSPDMSTTQMMICSTQDKDETLPSPSFPYHHKPVSLDTDSIRLLCVHEQGPDESANSQICATIECIELDKAPPFHALSYTWGDPSDKLAIRLRDGHSQGCQSGYLTVTRNCYNALLSLRKRLGNFKIWIDAICVNQTDAKEVSHQISLMGTIYSRASYVYIWLGTGSPATSRAMACLDYIKEPELFSRYSPRRNFRSRLWRFHRKNIIAMKLDVFWPWRFIRCLVYLLPESRKAIFKMHKEIPEIFPGAGYQRKHRVQVFEFAELLETPWLERIWTFQEIMLARSPVIVRGNDYLAWDDYALGILTLNIASLSRKIQDHLSLDRWMRLVLDREEFLRKLDRQGDSHHQDNDYCPMSDYRKTVRRMPNRSIFLHLFWGLFLVCITSTNKTDICPIRRISECNPFEPSPIVLSIIFFSTLVHVVLFRFRSKWTLACQEMDGLVYAALTRRATNDRDYNNGIRCCVAASLGELPQRIDPTVSTSTMHHDLAYQLLKATKCGHILVAAAFISAHGCPSWVPDWTYPWSKPFDIYEESGPKWSQSGATRGSKMDIVLDSSPTSTLLIRGKILAEIRTVYECFDDLEIERKIRLCQALLEKWRISRSCEIIDHSKCENHKKCPKNSNTDQWTYDRMREELCSLNHHLEHMRSISQQCRHQPDTPELKKWAEYSICAVGGRWCLFDAVETLSGITGTNIWDIGCAKDDIRAGDQIALLSGVTTPLILRFTNGMFRLISPARRLDEAMTGFYWNEFQVCDYPYLELC